MPTPTVKTLNDRLNVIEAEREWEASRPQRAPERVTIASVDAIEVQARRVSCLWRANPRFSCGTFCGSDEVALTLGGLKRKLVRRALRDKIRIKACRRI